jgi:hypothetical protein
MPKKTKKPKQRTKAELQKEKQPSKDFYRFSFRFCLSDRYMGAYCCLTWDFASLLE